MMELVRCGWAGTDPRMIAYHDKEWGVPVHDDRFLFEFLTLEGAQAGLSWETILKRRENYRRAFRNFDVEKVARRVEQLHEANPMLGHRGCRLAITYPEILEMQVRAIVEAAIECQKNGLKVLPEIMIPLTLDRKELAILEQATRSVADGLIKKAGAKLPYLVGTMIELPRAALLADEIAGVAEFFSFGTNDLTQTTMGLSRDDAGRFLPDYVDEKKAGVFAADPFQSLDTKGVGMLMEWAIEKGRETRPKLKVGICGEHGGDAESVKFCHKIGMDYVSASPFRVPISRLAAAQVVVEERQTRKKK